MTITSNNNLFLNWVKTYDRDNATIVYKARVIAKNSFDFRVITQKLTRDGYSNLTCMHYDTVAGKYGITYDTSKGLVYRMRSHNGRRTWYEVEIAAPFGINPKSVNAI